jgi:hypothetical protein
MIDDLVLSEISYVSGLICDLGFDGLSTVARKNSEGNPRFLPMTNIENIESGISGYLLFNLALIDYCQDDSLTARTERIIQEVVDHCRSNETTNYSLYTGRGGFVYLLMQFYRISGDDRLLDYCIELIKPADGEFLNSGHVSDYLFDGRAGTLLVLIELFQLTGSQEVLTLIEKFSFKVMSNGILSWAGMSWRANGEMSLGDSCGFALGVGGILYVLRKTALVFRSPSLDFCISHAANYLEEYWSGEEQNWPVFEKKIGEVASLLSYKSLYMSSKLELLTPAYSMSWGYGKVGILNCYEGDRGRIRIGSIEKIGNNIYEGLAGIGLLLLDRDRSDSMLLTIVNQLQRAKSLNPLEGGLMFGNLGVHYFLLCYYSENIRNSLLTSPGVLTPIAARKVKLKVDLVEIKSSIVGKDYKVTILVLQALFSNLWESFCSSDRFVTVADFVEFVEGLVNSGRDASKIDRLDDVFSFENQKCNFINRQPTSSLEMFLEQNIANDELFKSFSRSDEWILDHAIQLSDQILTVSCKWDWPNIDQHSIDKFLEKEAGQIEYVFAKSCSADGIKAFSLVQDGLVFHRFHQPKSIISVLAEIKLFCESHPPEMLAEISKNTSSSGVQDFIERIDFLITFKVKQLLFYRVLKFCAD